MKPRRFHKAKGAGPKSLQITWKGVAHALSLDVPLSSAERARFAAIRKWREENPEEYERRKKLNAERIAMKHRQRRMKVTLPTVRCLDGDND